jgi:hypothetical protein
MEKATRIATTSQKIIFGLYGAGGFAREVMPLVTEYVSTVLQANTEATYQIFFVETNPKQKEVNGYQLISEKE